MSKEKPEAWEAVGPAQDGLYNIHSENWIQALRDAYKDKEPGTVISNPPWLICRCSKANAPRITALPKMLELLRESASTRDAVYADSIADRAFALVKGIEEVAI